jgi:hypothetical protein
MPVDQATYQKAVSAVRSGQAPDDVMDGLMDIIDEYESAAPEAAAPPKTAANFGEGGSVLGTGPVGMDMLAEKIPQQGPDDMVIEAMKDPKNRMAAGSKKMDVASDDDALAASLKRSAEAEKRRVAEAEFIPPAKSPAPMGGVDPMTMFSASLDNARQNLPAFAGGKVEHYLEPPISQFQRDMAQVYGPEVRKMTHTSPEYLDYADGRWQEILEAAKAEGRSVVRNAYRQNKTLGQKVESGAAAAIGMGAAAAIGADEAAFGGLGRRLAASGDEEQLANYDRLAETNPGSRVVGNLLGAGSSIGAGGLASRAIGGQGLARGALRGAASGAATETSLAASKGELPGAGDLATGAALGAPFGAIGGMHGKNLRQSTALGDIERSGMGETEVFRGVRRSPKATQLRETAAEKLGSPDRAVDMMAGELEGPMLKAGRELADRTQADIGTQQATYFNMTKDVRKPTTPLLKQAMEVHAGGSYDAGGNLAAHGPQNRRLQQIIQDASHAELVPSANDSALAKPANAQTFDLTVEEATAKGIDVDRITQNYMGHGGELPPEFMIRVTPKQMNPEQTENVIRLLQEQIGEGKNVGALETLGRAAREVRDQFPAMGGMRDVAPVDIGTGSQAQTLKGWSSFQQGAAQKTAQTKRTLEMAGLPKGEPPAALDAGQAQGQFGVTRNYREPGRHPDADTALRELAGMAGKGKELEELAGMKGLDKARGGVPLSKRGLMDAGRYRLDPLMTFYGPGFGAVAPHAGQTMRPQQQLDPQMPPEMLEAFRKWGPNFQGP